MKYYCLYDVCTSEYGVLFGAYNDEDCRRKLAFSQQSNPYLQDLKLFRVGEVSPDTGVFTMCGSGNPEFICNMTDIVTFNPQGAVSQ